MESLGNPFEVLTGIGGAGRGKTVVDSWERCGAEKDKERRRCQAKSDLVFKIQRGRQMAQVEKFIESTSGFDSGPTCDETLFMALAFLWRQAALTPPPGLETRHFLGPCWHPFLFVSAVASPWLSSRWPAEVLLIGQRAPSAWFGSDRAPSQKPKRL